MIKQIIIFTPRKFVRKCAYPPGIGHTVFWEYRGYFISVNDESVSSFYDNIDQSQMGVEYLFLFAIYS
jgi:hypothetical protein